MNATPIWDNGTVTLPASTPVPGEVTRVNGCTCRGGITTHATECAIWQLDPEWRATNIKDARRRLDEYMAIRNRQGVPPLEIQRLNEDAAARSAADREQAKVIGSLLVGGAMLFGKRVEIAWPDGLPNGMTEEHLKVIGQNMLDAP